MKEKIVNFTFCLLTFVGMIMILANNTQVAEVIMNAVDLFLRRVFVSLFPMFIINDLFIHFHFAYFFYKAFYPFFQVLFKTSGIGAYVMIMSLLSGTPSNAYILKILVEEDTITVEEANHFLSFTYFSNPLFLITMLSVMFPTPLVIKIILIHYISNLMIGFLLRKEAPPITHKKIQMENTKVGSILILSIKKSIHTLLMILGTIVFYMLLTYLATALIPFPPFFKTILAGFLELTNGLHSLTFFVASNSIKEIMAVAMISFGGLSIHTQIKSILEDTPIQYSYFLKGRVWQVVISVLLAIIF